VNGESAPQEQRGRVPLLNARANLAASWQSADAAGTHRLAARVMPAAGRT